MKKISNRCLCLAAILIAVSGCTPEPGKTTVAPARKTIRNNAAVVDYRSVPAGYDARSANLLCRPLQEITASPGPSVVQRFEMVTDTGVDFENFLDRDRPLQLIETGSGVAIGDYDNDGILDLYLVGCDIQNKLYRGLGDFKFEDVTLAAGVTGLVDGLDVWGSSASFADVDNDGDLDLFVCNMSAPNLLYINQGDGTFDEQAEIRSVRYQGASKVANFCDYDRDGDLDMYLLTYQDWQLTAKQPFEMVNSEKRVKPEWLEHYVLIDGHADNAGELDIVYQNDGNGVFTDVSVAAGIRAFDRGLGAVWFDYDNDGWQDIYVTNDFKNPDHLYRNNHDGTFTDVLPKVVRHTPWFSMGLDFGDLNNDGLLDLIAADMASTSHYRQKLNMGGMNDSNWFLSRGEPRQYMKNVMYINSGAGKFMEMAKMAGMSNTDWTWSVRIVDLDNDGLEDVYVTNGHARDNMNADIANQIQSLMDANASQAELDRISRSVPAVKEKNLAFHNLGNLQFEKIGHEWNLDHEGISHGAAFADLDNDGDLDLVVSNYYEQASVYRNNSEEGRRLLVEFRCRDNNFFGFGTKVEVWQGDQCYVKYLAPVRGYLASDPPVVHFGFKDSSTIDRLRVTWPDGSKQEFNNLDAGFLYRVVEATDRIPASAATDQIANTVFKEVSEQQGLNFKHAERPFDDYQREPLLPYKLSELGSGIAWGDVNRDGYPDLFCGGAKGQTGQLFLNNAGIGFDKLAGPWETNFDREDKGMLFLDVDGDGDQDLYVGSGSTECEPADDSLRDRIYLNDGSGLFSEAPGDVLPDLKENTSAVAAVDFDQDGDLDLFVGTRSVPGKYPLTPNSHLLINAGGKFSVAPESVAPGLEQIGLVNSAVWTDYDNDGWSDLVIALDWGAVTFFKNENGTLTNVTSQLGLNDKLGWWRGIAVADLDDDGDVDFVVTNQGRNSKYHADAKHPHRLYYNDFDKSGTLDLVEAEFEGDTEYPVRGRSCSSSAMPFVADKFETYHDFAMASLSEIYETDDKQRAHREVNFLDSAILWNDSTKFRVESLPYLAQISPGFGVKVADFDGDSSQDILIANNFFASQVETGFMDGGLGWFLKGDGTGNFVPVWPNKSGVVISGDSSGLATADFDLDGDLDAVIGVNNETVRLLRNETEIELGVSLKLEGPLIGARITLIGNNAKRVYDLTAGGSYLSQDFHSGLMLSPLLLKKFTRIEVQWPDGTRSTREIDPRAKTIIIGKTADT